MGLAPSPGPAAALGRISPRSREALARGRPLPPRDPFPVGGATVESLQARRAELEVCSAELRAALARVQRVGP